MTENEMVGHHRLNGHEFEQTPRDSEGQGSLVCCSPWGRRVRYDLVTEQQQQVRAERRGCQRMWGKLTQSNSAPDWM